MLTRIAEKLGILDKIAPRKKSKATENDSSSNVKAGNNKRKLTAQESRDESLARKFQAEEDRRFNMLKAQKDAEDRAEKAGLFAKRQRVIYLHRGTNTQYDAIVVGVHFDDGPDNPYYTIKYKKLETFDDGNEELIDMEKQTTPDRLTRLPWNEEKSWEVIQ